MTKNQLHEALHLGLTDPDIQINEVAWAFVRDNGKVGEFRGELKTLASKAGREGSKYFRELASEILDAVEKSRLSEGP